jgi:glyoxylase-like metal-dependent hydrolase (beta-lactamase superfamily II)/rhodanese-related sulfurtransferase
MYFNQLLNEDAGCSSYVVASRKSKEAIVVDPALAIDQYLELAERRDLKVVMVIDTHIHADHISGARKLAAVTGAELAMHESADVLYPFRGLQDGEKLQIGQLVIEVLHTPGHRPELISLVITNPDRSPEPSMVLTGDSMFVGDVGRPDFGGAEGARRQYQSVHRLLELNDYVEVFPAHFEGSCGKGMCGRPSTTIGFERRFSPVLQLDEEAFLDSVAEAPPRPLNMNAIIATNRGEAEHLEAEPRGFEDTVEILAAEAPEWIAQHQPRILDVREPWEYEAVHIEGATSLPQAEIADQLDSLRRDDELLVVCAGGVRSQRVSQYLLANGFAKVTSLNGGMQAWVKAGLPVEGQVVSAGDEPDRYFHGSH